MNFFKSTFWTKRSLLIKFILVSFFISAAAVILGFFGTALILRSRDKKIENFFIPQTLRSIELLQKKTQMPIGEIVDYYNNEALAPNELRSSPVTLSVIKKVDASFPLPIKAKTFLEIKGKTSSFDMFKDQVYNFDGESFLVFRFNHGPPGEMVKSKEDKNSPSTHFPKFILPLFLTFIIILLVMTSSVVLIHTIFKVQAKKAADVLRALKLGDLKARFPISKIAESNELMLEFNQMADEIEKLVVDLRDVDSLRRKLLQELAHDLRTPISSMKSLLESLVYQNDKMREDQKIDNLQMSLKEVDYFHHLVEDLLFLSGVHDLKYRGKFSSVDVVDIIQHEVQIYNEANKKIRVSFIYEQFSFVKADQHLFQRLMKNAISNAVENASTSVLVNLIEDNDNLIIKISNDGAAMDVEEIKTFGKKRATRKIIENSDGKISVGLGAVIMNKICEIHSAEMSITNNPREGKIDGVTLAFHFSLLKMS